MLDINYIRDNADHVQKSAENKGYNLSIAELLQIDYNRRKRLTLYVPRGI